MNAEKLNVLLELLSSSSSEEEDEVLIEVLSKESTIPKIKNFVENVVNKFTDVEFRKVFRMHRKTVDLIINDYSASAMFRKRSTWARGKPIISAEKQILLFLWFATNKCSLRDVSNRFDVSTSTAGVITEKVMNYLIEVAPTYIKFSNSSENKEKIASAFLNVSGFPGVLGCIGGTSINVITPAHKIKATYVNQQDVPSLTLQGICDANKKFLDVFTGVPGKIHDACVLKLSDIYTQIPNICGQNYHLLGDSAYPLREWCLTPYEDYEFLTAKEKVFNKKLCGTRVLIENTFGLLKSRFRQLFQIDMHSVNKISKFIITCCVLHNLCIITNDELEKSEVLPDLDSRDDSGVISDSEIHLRKLGELKRNNIRDRFIYE